MRNPTVDILKALASQLIVLHHLMLYTPMSNSVAELWPALHGLLSNEARYVVQIFLVIGGYLAAKSLTRLLKEEAGGLGPKTAITLVAQRYWRLVKPYWVAIAAALVLGASAAWLAGSPMDAERPSLWQVLAHLVLLHDIVGVQALSAGVWYVAIDLQLFAGAVFLVWACRRLADSPIGQWWTPHTTWVVAASSITVLSLLWWNTRPELDEWAVYFAGSYGLGVLAHWAVAHHRRVSVATAIALVLAAALWFQWRERLLITGITAILMIYSDALAPVLRALNGRLMQAMADMSYCVFLIHYPVLVFTSAVVLWMGIENTAAMGLALLATWALSMAVGWVMHRWIEVQR
ncbi:MAG: acyltransferase family protein [Limnobacter sp.]|uniref:acyltransferase family protein n=1 Tax=Limnobacter sp. TaxID=2003368 RepID=UPI00391B0718